MFNLGKTEAEMNKLKLNEIKNGRLAMIACLGYAAQVRGCVRAMCLFHGRVRRRSGARRRAPVIAGADALPPPVSPAARCQAVVTQEGPYA